MPRRLVAGTLGFEDMEKALRLDTAVQTANLAVVRLPEPGPLAPEPVLRTRTALGLVRSAVLPLQRRTAAEADKGSAAVPEGPSGHMAEPAIALEDFLVEDRQAGSPEGELDLWGKSRWTRSYTH